MMLKSKVVLFLRLLVAAAAITAVWYFFASMNEVRSLLTRSFSERVYLVSTYISMVQQQVDGMARTLEQNYGKCDTVKTFYARFYREKSVWGLSGFSADGGIGGIEGTCTGTGPFPINAADRKELAAAISLDPQIRSVLNYNKNVTWIYYTSAREFIYLVPKLRIDEYQFSLSEYSRPFWLQAAPDRNPGHRQIISDLYEDSVGKGLMITISSPVLINGKFAGVMSLDLGIDLLRKLALTGDIPGETILTDENGKIVVRTGSIRIGETYPLPSRSDLWMSGDDGYFWLRRELGDGEINMLHRIKKSSYYMAAARRSLYVWGMAAFMIMLFILVNRDLTMRNREETARKKTEDALLESETRLKAFMDNVPAMIVIKDHELRPVFANKTMMHYFPVGDWMGKKPGETFSEDIAGLMIEKDREALEKGSVSYEELWKDKHGTDRTLFTQKFRIERSGSEPMIGAIISDITSQVETSRMLREKENELSTLISNLPGFIYRCANDRDWTMFFISDVCEKITGYRPDELVNNKSLSFNDLIRDEYKNLIWEMSQREISSRQPFEYEYPIITKSGEKRWVWERGRAIYSESGEILFLEGFITDITDRKSAESERSRLQEQLNQSQKIESIGRLAGGVAHDFNNMLGVIIGQAELGLMKTDPSSPVFHWLTEIKKAARRSADLTARLLAFARKQTVNPRVIDLNNAITGMISMLARLIGEEIELSWNPGINLMPVRIDPSQIDQLLANLCVNARDAITGQGRISIETCNIRSESIPGTAYTEIVPGDYVMLTVSDTGSGFTGDVYEHLFEPFFTTKNSGKGTGLGLAMVYGIVRQNNGHITVESAPGMGTIFRICLPAEKEASAAEDEQDSYSLPDVTRDETVLLVEDEPMLLDMSRSMLEELGYSVIAVSNPGEALNIANEHKDRIRLLLTDVIMPGMNGRDLSEKLNALHPEIKCIYMSGYTADLIAHHGVLDDGVNFIQKPFNITELAAGIKKALA